MLVVLAVVIALVVAVIAVVVVVLGVLIIVRPGSALFTPAALLPLGAALHLPIAPIMPRLVDTDAGPAMRADLP